MELPPDPDLWTATTAIGLYGKTLAHSALGNIAEAEEHRELFLAAAARVPGVAADAQQHGGRSPRGRERR